MTEPQQLGHMTEHGRLTERDENIYMESFKTNTFIQHNITCEESDEKSRNETHIFDSVIFDIAQNHKTVILE